MMEIMQQEEHCSDTMCAFLPIGYMLLSADIVHDLSWCLFPSRKTREAVTNYYTNLLTPKLSPLPWPGYLFPSWAIFIFLRQCPDIYNYYTFLLYLPLIYRYWGILQQTDKTLGAWWTVILIRILLTIVTTLSFSNRGCVWSNFGSYFVKTIGLSEDFMLL